MPSIIHSEIHTLKDALAGMESTTRANCIYIVRHNTMPIYVGKTVQGVARRLRQHISYQDELGVVLKTAIQSGGDWAIEIWHIDHGLVTVERQAIAQLRPYLNKAGHR